VIRRYVAAVLVVAIVLAGVWVTGAVITNEFRADGGDRVLTLTTSTSPTGPTSGSTSSGPARTEADVKDLVDLGGLNGNIGDQQYRIPRPLDLKRYAAVVIWCRASSVLFARASLRA